MVQGSGGKMKLDKNSISRVGIYSFFDKQGIVDRYVECFLEDFKKNVKELIVVCNGTLTASERKKFVKYADKVIERENKGFDIWGYKCGFDYYGWEKLCNYDEIVVANNTLMGPVYPFSEMFSEMAERDLDFWGITKHYSFDFDPFGCNEYGYIPDHIQSYFVVFRKAFVASKDFQEYWDNLPELNSYDDAVGKHETVFTKKFGDKGYKWDTYVYTDDIKDLNQNLLMVVPKLLIEQKKCPIFKRRNFFQPYEYMLHNTTGQPAMELYEYLRVNNLYDTDMIWENLLRTCNHADFVKNLQLQYILPSNMAPVEQVNSYLKNNKVALIMHLYFEDLIEYSFKYASSMPADTDIYITTDTEKKKEKIIEKFTQLKCSKLEVRIVQNRGRDVSGLLVGVKDIIMNYDVACFVHDKKCGQIEPGSVGDSFSYKCFENTLHNTMFVYNVIHTFIENPRLGILSPPAPNHNVYYTTLGAEWVTNFENTKELASELGITVPMDEAKEPVAPFGTFFWFRPAALRILFDNDWEYEDFPPEPNGIDGTLLHAIERLYPFAAQQAGFYPGYLMVDKFAAIEVNNLAYYLREYNHVLLENRMGCSHITIRDTLKNVLNGDTTVPVYQQLNDCMEVHEHVCNEWTRTAEALKALQKNYDHVNKEWEKTAEELKQITSAHNMACDEWSKTAQELNRLRQDYSNVLNSFSWKAVSVVNRLIDKIRRK